MKTCVLMVGVALLLVACAQPRISQSQQLLEGPWAGMWYKEALQRLGPPRRCDEVEETRVCEWVKGETRTVQIPVYNTGIVETYTVPPSSVILTFMDDRMVRWQLVGRWD